MAVHGVLFDFSGTLFRLEFDAEVTRGLTGVDDEPLDEATHAALLRLLTAPSAVANLPADLLEDWEHRDLDADVHHAVSVAAMRHAGLTAEGAAETFYQRVHDPDSWRPYPDTIAALRLVRSYGLPVAVVSNIAWPIEPVFRMREADPYVNTYVLSYLEGVVKPDPRIFATACERIGVEPSQALMIGDSEAADGGARALGAAFEAVPAIPTTARPDALLTALATHGLT